MDGRCSMHVLLVFCLVSPIIGLNNVELVKWILRHGDDIQILELKGCGNHAFGDSQFPDDTVLHIKPNGTDIDDIKSMLQDHLAKRGTNVPKDDDSGKKPGNARLLLKLVSKPKNYRFASANDILASLRDFMANRDMVHESSINEDVKSKKAAESEEGEGREMPIYPDVSRNRENAANDADSSMGDGKDGGSSNGDTISLERLAKLYAENTILNDDHAEKDEYCKSMNDNVYICHYEYIDDSDLHTPHNNCTPVDDNEYLCHYKYIDDSEIGPPADNCTRVNGNEYICHYEFTYGPDTGTQPKNCIRINDSEYLCHYKYTEKQEYEEVPVKCTFVNEIEYHCHYIVTKVPGLDEVLDNCTLVNDNEYICLYIFTENDERSDVKRYHHHSHHHFHHHYHHHIHHYHHHHYHRRHYHHHIHHYHHRHIHRYHRHIHHHHIHHYHHRHTHHYHRHYHHHHIHHYHHYHHHHYHRHHYHHHIHHYHHHHYHRHHYHHHPHHYHHHHYHHHIHHHHHYHRHHYHHHHYHRHHYHHHIHHYHRHHYHHHIHHYHYHHHPVIHRGSLSRSCQCRIDFCNCCINQAFRVNFFTHMLRFRLNACLAVRRIHHYLGYALTFTVNHHRLMYKRFSMHHFHRRCYRYGPMHTCLNIYRMSTSRRYTCARITGQLTLGGVPITLHTRIGCFGLPFEDGFQGEIEGKFSKYLSFGLARERETEEQTDTAKHIDKTFDDADMLPVLGKDAPKDVDNHDDHVTEDESKASNNPPSGILNILALLRRVGKNQDLAHHISNVEANNPMNTKAKSQLDSTSGRINAFDESVNNDRRFNRMANTHHEFDAVPVENQSTNPC